MAYDFSHVNILVVECTPAMYQLLKSVLHMLKIPQKNVYDAYNPKEAFAKFKNIRHDLIITDWLENPDEGIALTKMLRTDESSPNPYVPIIMTAGSGHLSRVLKARDSGVSDYVVKPFSAKTLADRLERIIEDKRKFVISGTYTGPDRRRKSNKNYDGPERRKNQDS
jgi:DNA-binding response OmpR family regulator